MKGRTVKIYLVDGIPSGVMTAEIMNWTGRFTVAPRNQLVDLAAREELKRTGVYILAGKNPEDPAQETVYIGESDNIWKRLIQHNNDPSKDFWGKTIVITSKDENLTKAHGRYLESRIIQIANQAQRAHIINETNPVITGLPEPDIADMEYFLAQVQMILPVLGFNFAIPLPNPNINEESAISSPIFCFDYGGTKAEAHEINDEFIVFKGSTVRIRHTNSLADSYVRIRERLLREGRLATSPDPDYWEFTQDVPFQSPSTAANVAGGASLNGRQHWHVKESGKTYAQWQNDQIQRIEAFESLQEESL